MKTDTSFEWFKNALHEKIFHFKNNSLSCANLNEINGVANRFKDFPAWMLCERFKLNFEELQDILNGETIKYLNE